MVYKDNGNPLVAWMTEYQVSTGEFMEDAAWLHWEVSPSELSHMREAGYSPGKARTALITQLSKNKVNKRSWEDARDCHD